MHLEQLTDALGQHSTIRSLLNSSIWDAQARLQVQFSNVFVALLNDRIASLASCLNEADVKAKNRPLLSRIFTRTLEQRTIREQLVQLPTIVMEIEDASLRLSANLGTLPINLDEQRDEIHALKLEIRSLELDAKQIRDEISVVKSDGRVKLAMIRKKYIGAGMSSERIAKLRDAEFALERKIAAWHEELNKVLVNIDSIERRKLFTESM